MKVSVSYCIFVVVLGHGYFYKCLGLVRFCTFLKKSLQLFNSVCIQSKHTVKTIYLFEYMFKCNLFLWSKLNFQHHYSSLQSVSHGPLEIILICWLERNICEFVSVFFFTFTFMHLVDAFIQSDLQSIQAIHFISVCVFPGNRTHNLLRC